MNEDAGGSDMYGNAFAYGQVQNGYAGGDREQVEPSFPPRMTQEQYQQEMMASLKKRGSTQNQGDQEIEFLATQMSHYDHHMDGARQLDLPDENYVAEFIQLKKEKESLQQANAQIEQKL